MLLKTDVPQEQLDRIQPVLELLLASLRRQSQNLPPEADSALVYRLGADREEGQ